MNHKSHNWQPKQGKNIVEKVGWGAGVQWGQEWGKMTLESPPLLVLCKGSKHLYPPPLLFWKQPVIKSHSFHPVPAESLSHVWLSATPWTAAHQVPLSMGLPRQEYWSGCPFPPPGIFLIQRSNPHLLHWEPASLPLSHSSPFLWLHSNKPSSVINEWLAI